MGIWVYARMDEEFFGGSCQPGGALQCCNASSAISKWTEREREISWEGLTHGPWSYMSDSYPEKSEGERLPDFAGVRREGCSWRSPQPQSLGGREDCVLSRGFSQALDQLTIQSIEDFRVEC